MSTSPFIYFLHIPKTSGTSLRMYLESQYPVHEVFPWGDWAALHAVPVAERARYRLIRGHFGAGLRRSFPEPPQMITMLRQPLAQAVSHWQYVASLPDHTLHRRLLAAGGDFSAFVGIRPSNLMARTLADVDYRSDLAWRVDDRQPEPAELLDRALARLDECVAFGLAERHDDALAVFAHQFGWTPPAPNERINAHSGKRYSPSVEEAAAFLAANQVDLALYREAERIFERRHRLMVADDPNATYKRRLASRARALTEPVHVDMGVRVDGAGWSVPSETVHGAVRWMAATKATLDLPMTLPRFATVEALCLGSMRPDLLAQLELQINGKPAPLVWRETQEGMLLRAVVPAGAAGAELTELCFRLPETVPWQLRDTATDFGVGLGIALSWVRVVPAHPRRADGRNASPARQASSPAVTFSDAELVEQIDSLAATRSGAPWSVPEEVANQVATLGLASHVADLHRDGFTVIPEVVDGDTVARVRRAVLAGIRPGRAHHITGLRSAVGETHMTLGTDPVFTEVLAIPQMLTLADVVCGKGMLAMQHGSVRDDHCAPICLHAENAMWLPAPYPDHEYVLLTILTCDEFNEQAGGTRFLPGSHRTRRDPTFEEAFSYDGNVAAEAKPGSLIAWLGTTWHGTFPRQVPGQRVGLHTLFTRPALRPTYDLRWIPDSQIPTDDLRVRLRRADAFDQPAYQRPSPAVCSRSQAWNRGLGDVALTTLG